MNMVTVRMRRIADRRSIVRPARAPLSFVCPACEMVLHDGVDYLSCPRCSRPVDWVDLTKPLWCCTSCESVVNEACADWPRCAACDVVMTRVHAREAPPELSVASSNPGDAVTVAMLAMAAIKLAQIIVLALDPLGFVFVAPLLMLAVLGAGTLLVVVFGSLGELRALVRDQRTRVIHGLEHACVKMLERRRCKPLNGQTHEGFFEVEIANDGRASVEAVELAAELAVARVASGEVALALDRRCGTSLLVGAVVVAMLVVGAAVLGLVEGIHPGALAAGTAVSAVLAWWGSRPVGIWVQRTLTVSTRFADAQIERVVRVVHASGDAATFRVYVAVELT